MFEDQLEGQYLDIANCQEEEQDAFLKKANVVGVGVGHKVTEGKEEENEPCMAVFVSQKLPLSLLKDDDIIPKDIGNLKTDVIETGEIFAGNKHVPLAMYERAIPAARHEKNRQIAFHELEEPPSVEEFAITEEEFAGIQILKARMRPAEGGASIGHYHISAGTIATAVYDTSAFTGIPRRYYILSNNHVLANSNDARIGDPILQPGWYDGGRYPEDLIARLSQFVPIRFGGQSNYVDAAIAEARFQDIDRTIYWIGYVKGVAPPRIGMIVQKTGRTTNYTTGRITHVNATVNVNYGGGKVARMQRQILTTNMSAGGDSGSLLCDMNENAVGLLFAGSSSVTVHNDIRYVQALLGIKVA